jgi:hypothetical protein
MALMLNILDYFRAAPKFEVWHSHPGRTAEVLITAGMHGDERSGIQAAQSLIKSYQGDTPLTIIPILNVAGYSQSVSYNPLDHKDPIYCYPGSRFGSSTLRLMHQVSRLTQGKKLWIDLHSGATGEHLKPFIWAADNYAVLSYVKGRTLVESSFARDLPYLILESGELGHADPQSVALHLTWIKQILNNLHRSEQSRWRPTYTALLYDKNSGQDQNADNFLWSSPTHYISGKITQLEGGQDGNALVSKTNVRKD